MKSEIEAGGGSGARPPLQVRRPKGSLSDAIPRHWYAGDAFPTHLLNSFSSTLPAGESFFVRSVIHYRDRIDDPALREAIRGFAGQEGQHSRHHDEHVEVLLDQGYTALATRNRILDRILHWQNSRMPAFSLAITAALEHLTAILARQILSDRTPRTADMHPEMARLWRWHALEEAEHKAVAFDVLMQVAPSPALRRLAMVLTSIDLTLEVFQRAVYMLYKDGLLFDRATWAAGLRFLFGRQGLLRGVGGEYRAWYRAGFHPDQIDDRKLIEAQAPLVALEIAG